MVAAPGGYFKTGQLLGRHPKAVVGNETFLGSLLNRHLKRINDIEIIT